MSNRRNALTPILFSVLTATASASHVGRAQTPNTGGSCSDPAETMSWAGSVADRFRGLEEGQIEFRQMHGFERLDSTAVVEPVTDEERCGRIAAQVRAHLPSQMFPYWLRIAQIGPYYVVAVVNTMPPPPGREWTGRALVMVLRVQDLAVLADRMLM